MRQCVHVTPNSKPVASELRAAPFSMAWPNGRAFMSVLSVTKQHLLCMMCGLGCAIEAAWKCLGSTPFCFSPEKLSLKQVSYPDVSFPSRLGLTSTSVILLTPFWETKIGGQKVWLRSVLPDSCTSTIYSTLIFSERLHNRRSKLSDPVMETSKE